MKVIAKFRNVEVTFPNGEIVVVTCKTITDALAYTRYMQRAIVIRERASTTKSYPHELYQHLLEIGVVEKEKFEARVTLAHKAKLVQNIQNKWY